MDGKIFDCNKRSGNQGLLDKAKLELSKSKVAGQYRLR